MYLTTIDEAGHGAMLVIHTSEMLDFSGYEPICEACKRSWTLYRIDVDLQGTRDLRDSGIGILMMLALRARTISRRIRFINCSKAIRKRLETVHLPGNIQFS